jgi:hypothetical protein
VCFWLFRAAKPRAERPWIYDIAAKNGTPIIKTEYTISKYMLKDALPLYSDKKPGIARKSTPKTILKSVKPITASPTVMLMREIFFFSLFFSCASGSYCQLYGGGGG